MSEGHPRQQRRLREIERIRGLVTGHPEGSHRSAAQVEQAGMTRGQHLADRITEVLGSWKFIIVQSSLLLLWLIINTLGWIHHWDPYPFILLNLALSFQAAFTAPIIMMSQNRQADRDRVASELDFEVNRNAAKEVDEIQAKLDGLTSQQLQTLLDNLEEHRVLLHELHKRTDRIERLILETRDGRETP
ncbi:MAG: DUF1003 domain-containing protein [Thermomicrobiales bacterium]|nr:DUF1003 domain-containing protein [Thermomicrobiales bacterium]